MPAVAPAGQTNSSGIMIYTEDADAMFARATSAGATVGGLRVVPARRTATPVRNALSFYEQPGILDRIGWKFNMIKTGDKITTIIAPLRTGEAGGLLKQVTLADGRKFENGAPAGKPNIQ